jgi:hypothetical protein
MKVNRSLLNISSEAKPNLNPCQTDLSVMAPVFLLISIPGKLCHHGFVPVPPARTAQISSVIINVIPPITFFNEIHHIHIHSNSEFFFAENMFSRSSMTFSVAGGSRRAIFSEF